MAQTTFAYKVRDSSGKLIEGTLDADNDKLVATRLRSMGYVPVEYAAKGGASGAMKKDLHLPGMGGRVPSRYWRCSAGSSPPSSTPASP